MQYFLKFIYFIIKNILKIRKELKDEHEFKNKDIKIA